MSWQYLKKYQLKYRSKNNTYKIENGFSWNLSIALFLIDLSTN